LKTMLLLPRFYAILDAACFLDATAMFAAAEELAAAGCTLLQYRNKQGTARQMLAQARELRARLGVRADTELLCPPATTELRSAWTGEGVRPHTSANIKLIMNDRADLCLAAGFDGLHVGQEDLSPEAARRIIGPSPSAAKAAGEGGALAARVELVPFPEAIAGGIPKGRWLGVSTHNPEQLAEADQSPADYLAIGPVFATTSKANPDPVVGLAGVRRARELTRKPLVAIGGITRANARSVIDAGADSVAVISDLLRDPRNSAEEFLRILG
jgi:thiamine-phosphate pyrophosphorylase